MAQQPEVLQIPLSWIGTDEVPILYVNQLMAQLDDRGDAIVSFGQATPPAAIGTPDEIKKQIERIAYVPVRPVARMLFTRDRLIQLITVLTQTLDNQAQLKAQLPPLEGDPKP